MKQLQKIIRALSFTRSFPFFSTRRTGQASLVLVADSWDDCKNDAELILYSQLRAENFYPTPHYPIGGFRVNLALVPYRIALIEKNEKIEMKKITRVLRKKNWYVLFYEADKLTADTPTYLQMVRQYADQTKNVSI